MLSVQKIEGRKFTSNSYLLSHSNHAGRVWLVDAGEAPPLWAVLAEHQKIEGVFVTHPHYDHIAGLNIILDKFPACKIFCSREAYSGLFSSKANLSFYHEDPFELEVDNVGLIDFPFSMPIFPGTALEAFATPGHHPGAVTFQTFPYLFTGDAFIPSLNTVTKLKGGSKEDNQISLAFIHSLIDEGTVLCPGHGEMGSLSSTTKKNKARFGHLGHSM